MPICTECGHEHPLEDVELTFRRPDIVAKLSTEEREARVQENKDLCILDTKRFFIRALLPLPVIERDSSYNLGLWVEVSAADFDRIYEIWDAQDQAQEPAFKVQVANDIPFNPPAFGLSAELFLTGPTSRPIVILDLVEHPLVEEQIHGISSHRSAQYSSLFS